MSIEFGPPWHIESTQERTTAITGVQISATGGPICIAAAHAAPLIVQAVNCHDELVAALERLVGYGGIFQRGAYKQALAALAKARKETPQ